MEPEGRVAATEGVVDGEGGGDDGAVGAVGGEDAEGGGVGEEAGDVGEGADGGVIDDGVDVVEVEAVVEPVGVGERDGQHGWRGQEYAQHPGLDAGLRVGMGWRHTVLRQTLLPGFGVPRLPRFGGHGEGLVFFRDAAAVLA